MLPLGCASREAASEEDMADSDIHEPGNIMAVTGGAGGIGYSVAEQWIAKGGHVVLLDRDEDALAAATSALGLQARGLQLDVTSTASVREAVTSISRHEGRIHALVNCAGFARHGHLDTLDDRDFMETFDVHLGGTLRMCREAFGLLQNGAAENNNAAVVNLSSVAGTNGTPGRISYGTVKAGMTGLTRTLAVEWGSKHIRVNAVSPGPTRTALVDKLIQSGEIQLEPLTQRTPLGRVPDVSEVAAPIVFLCSPAASFVNGTCLPIDGGLTIEGNWYTQYS